MADNIANNPPQFDGLNASPKTFGTVLKYGLDGLVVTGILVDSYSREVKYAVTEEIIDQDGIVSGLRMSDGRAEISVSGRVKNDATAIVKAGSSLSINGEVGVITEVSMSAGSKEFVKVDIKAACYEGVDGLTPNGL